MDLPDKLASLKGFHFSFHQVLILVHILDPPTAELQQLIG
jgi:hypothetical protein